MNIAVINLRDVFKHLVKIIIIISSIIILTSILKSEDIQKQEEAIKETISSKTRQITKYSFTSCLDVSLSLISYSKNDEEKERLSPVSSILNLELGMLDKEILKAIDLTINEEELTRDDIEELESKIAELPKEVITEKVETNNLPERSTDSYENVYIKNESDYELTNSMLEPNIEIANKKDIFIYHAHTCESYTPNEQYNYEMTGNFRTTDLNYTVARVGTELVNYLKAKGFNVTHDTTYHDYPAYSGSYTRALETAQKNLYGTNTQLVIDLHRDAVGNSNEYGPTVKINDEYAAQLMFVIGTDGRGIRTSKLVTKPKTCCKNTKKSK